MLPEHYEESLYDDNDNVAEQLENATEEKVITDVSALMCLFKKCQRDGCPKKVVNATPKFLGSCISVYWKCEDGHKGSWHSSNKTRDIYTNNLILASAIYMSGNSVQKIQDFFNILNIHIQSERTIEYYQRKYIFPTVNDFYDRTQDLMFR